MKQLPRRFHLRCGQCAFREPLNLDDLLVRVRAAGYLRRDKDLDPPFVMEIVRTAAKKWTCVHCSANGLIVEESDTAGDWNERHCQRCGRTIPLERLEVIPGAMCCAPCEAKPIDEWEDESTFCPHCGSRMTTEARRSTGGITRYASICSNCGGPN